MKNYEVYWTNFHQVSSNAGEFRVLVARTYEAPLVWAWREYWKNDCIFWNLEKKKRKERKTLTTNKLIKKIRNKKEKEEVLTCSYMKAQKWRELKPDDLIIHNLYPGAPNFFFLMVFFFLDTKSRNQDHAQNQRNTHPVNQSLDVSTTVTWMRKETFGCTFSMNWILDDKSDDDTRAKLLYLIPFFFFTELINKRIICMPEITLCHYSQDLLK